MFKFRQAPLASEGRNVVYMELSDGYLHLRLIGWDVLIMLIFLGILDIVSEMTAPVTEMSNVALLGLSSVL